MVASQTLCPLFALVVHLKVIKRFFTSIMALTDFELLTQLVLNQVLCLHVAQSEANTKSINRK